MLITTKNYDFKPPYNKADEILADCRLANAGTFHLFYEPYNIIYSLPYKIWMSWRPTFATIDDFGEREICRRYSFDRRYRDWLEMYVAERVTI